MVEYGIAAGGATGGSFGGPGALDQLEALSSYPVALAIFAGAVVLIFKLLR